MNGIDLILLTLVVLAAWLGPRMGLRKLSGGLSALPASLGLAFALCGMAGLVMSGLTGLSPLTSRMLAFGALFVVALFALTQLVAKSFGMNGVMDRWGGLALASWSVFVTGCIALVFMANYPGGRAVVAGSLVGRLLHAL